MVSRLIGVSNTFILFFFIYDTLNNIWSIILIRILCAFYIEIVTSQFIHYSSKTHETRIYSLRYKNRIAVLLENDRITVML